MIILPYTQIRQTETQNTIRQVILAHGIIAYPTDTLYGLGGDFFSRTARRRIDSLKGRSRKPYSAAVSGLEMLGSLVQTIPPIFWKINRDHFPGKLTLLFPAGPQIDPDLLGGGSTIGIRMPGCPPLLELIDSLQTPLISTSLNISGQPPIHCPEEIPRAFPGLDVVISGPVLPPSRGSTVVDISHNSLRILREGDVPPREILQV